MPAAPSAHDAGAARCNKPQGNVMGISRFAHTCSTIDEQIHFLGQPAGGVTREQANTCEQANIVCVGSSKKSFLLILGNRNLGR